MSESELAREIFAQPEALERFRAQEGARATLWVTKPEPCAPDS